ncbi:MAG: polyprenol monophosphomannose synthase [Bacteroidetes bacterium]|nr:polyprenol monophosphomannose synthase [Bacteroidota bacterium]
MSEKKSENRVLIVIPTYNEHENIDRLLAKIREQPIQTDLLFIDDNSQDGTAELIKSHMTKDPGINLIQRPGKMGLGTAYLAGFKWALERDYTHVMEMDADLSHDPVEVPRFLEAAGEADVVLGSRYITGVNVINWPLKRLILSYGANVYAGIILGAKIKDLTGGYKLFRREVLEKIDLERVKSNGYSFQIEMTFRALNLGFKVKEVSIIFYDRTAGHSKMSKKIVREAILMVWKLKMRQLLGRL